MSCSHARTLARHNARMFSRFFGLLKLEPGWKVNGGLMEDGRRRWRRWWWRRRRQRRGGWGLMHHPWRGGCPVWLLPAPPGASYGASGASLSSEKRIRGGRSEPETGSEFGRWGLLKPMPTRFHCFHGNKCSRCALLTVKGHTNAHEHVQTAQTQEKCFAFFFFLAAGTTRREREKMKKAQYRAGGN